MENMNLCSIRGNFKASEKKSRVNFWQPSKFNTHPKKLLERRIFEILKRALPFLYFRKFLLLEKIFKGRLLEKSISKELRARSIWELDNQSNCIDIFQIRGGILRWKIFRKFWILTSEGKSQGTNLKSFGKRRTLKWELPEMWELEDWLCNALLYQMAWGLKMLKERVFWWLGMDKGIQVKLGRATPLEILVRQIYYLDNWSCHIFLYYMTCHSSKAKFASFAHGTKYGPRMVNRISKRKLFFFKNPE